MKTVLALAALALVGCSGTSPSGAPPNDSAEADATTPTSGTTTGDASADASDARDASDAERSPQPIINFSSNDYLGLTNHPKVKEAAKIAVDRYACGLSSSRVQATTVAHIELEERLAKWFKMPACLITTTGYQAMVGAIMSLSDIDTTLVLDQLSHACILDGSFLAAGVPKNGAEIRFFNHNSARSLERVLKTRERKHALVCLEGVYSLDGDPGSAR